MFSTHVQYTLPQHAGNINTGLSKLYIQPHKHTNNTNYIVKIIQTTFYRYQPHKYFNLIILKLNFDNIGTT